MVIYLFHRLSRCSLIYPLEGAFSNAFTIFARIVFISKNPRLTSLCLGAFIPLGYELNSIYLLKNFPFFFENFL